MENSQLIKKQNGGYSKVYPLAFIQGIIDAETNEKLTDILIRYNHIYVPWKGSPEDTRDSVPLLMRRHGLWISYDKDGSLYTEWFKNSSTDALLDLKWKDSGNWEMIPNLSYINSLSQQIPNGAILPEMLSPALQEFLSEHHTIINLPDDEDLEQHCNVVRFKDRGYNPILSSGKGYKILRKNWSGRHNSLSQEMISIPNTIYEVRYDFDLGGKEIIIPTGCVLKFEGGSFRNGTLIGTNTDIKADSLSNLFNNIVIMGTWKVANIYSKWFDFDFTEKANNQVNLQNLCNLTSDNFYGTIYIAPMTIWASTDKPNGSVMLPTSNTHIILDATINLNTNDYTHYDIIYAVDKDNIYIEGGGTIVGDLRTHTGTTGEFGFCIHFLGVKNGFVKNLSLIEAWGDSISIDSSSTRRSENIQISGLYCANSRRQGLSVEGAKDIYVKDCTFEGIYRGISGTFPGAAIDVEPWREGDVVENIYIENCTATNCYKGFVASGTSKNVVFSKCYAHNSPCQTRNFSEEVVYFRDCDFNGVLFCHSCNVEVSNSHINQVLFGSDPKHYSFKNCHIGGTNLQEVAVGSSSRGLICKTPDSSYDNNAVFDFIQCVFEPVLRTADNVVFNLTWSDLPANVKVNLYNCEILPIGTNVQNNYANLYNCWVRTNRFSLNRTCPYTIELVGNTFIQDSGDSFFQIDYDNGDDLLLFRAYNNSFIVAYPWFYFAYDPSGKKIEFVNNTFSIAALRSYEYAITNFYRKFSADSIIQFNRILPAITQGTTEERPSVGADNVGFSYYDTTLKKYICWDGNVWTNFDGSALT